MQVRAYIILPVPAAKLFVLSARGSDGVTRDLFKFSSRIQAINSAVMLSRTFEYYVPIFLFNNSGKPPIILPPMKGVLYE